MEDRMKEILENDGGEINTTGISDEIMGKCFQNLPVFLQKGEKVFRLEPVEVSSLTEVTGKYYRELIKNELAGYKRKIYNDFKKEVKNFRDWMERTNYEMIEKERELERKLRNNFVLPDVTIDHARYGLSVVKGPSPNSFTWMVRGVYEPKFVDDLAIEPSYVKKMKTPIIVVIKTEGNIISVVYTANIGDMSYFSHYHQQRPDCWGSWSYRKEWSQPEDILNVARQAQGVLEKINTRSIANRAPDKLPKLSILNRHLVKKSERVEAKDNKTNERMGLDALNSGWDTSTNPLPF